MPSRALSQDGYSGSRPRIDVICQPGNAILELKLSCFVLLQGWYAASTLVSYGTAERWSTTPH
jgi:hypothetical protein